MRRFRICCNILMGLILVITLSLNWWCQYTAKDASGCGFIGAMGGGLFVIVVYILIIVGFISTFFIKKEKTQDK